MQMLVHNWKIEHLPVYSRYYLYFILIFIHSLLFILLAWTPPTPYQGVPFFWLIFVVISIRGNYGYLFVVITTCAVTVTIAQILDGISTIGCCAVSTLRVAAANRMVTKTFNKIIIFDFIIKYSILVDINIYLLEGQVYIIPRYQYLSIGGQVYIYI